MINLFLGLTPDLGVFPFYQSSMFPGYNDNNNNNNNM